ncbi:hypothetical protein COCC4DRAFT_32356 [Bipolaris maydis ATCC 48331]|uniref:Uncharacterized protein n=2 Tax=Cochliobolus heterostrophus TaxID=5016 RepID=M2T5V8_COCH5|nr:uncharacterized protein COCC4DRAFT_32356 [Bipolaris maydis ATCC 48331]EMD92975.1 hypothetical protein COCHEDRAFT_1020829 [Bipolaris maydis C5]ENI04638.1 hypothetical protein COCC4DRAFT_32356 [Bipolaris maydis ATCC 48331]
MFESIYRKLYVSGAERQAFRKGKHDAVLLADVTQQLFVADFHKTMVRVGHKT